MEINDEKTAEEIKERINQRVIKRSQRITLASVLLTLVVLLSFVLAAQGAMRCAEKGQGISPSCILTGIEDELTSLGWD